VVPLGGTVSVATRPAIPWDRDEADTPESLDQRERASRRGLLGSLLGQHAPH
jgi:hypothetical protein